MTILIMVGQLLLGLSILVFVHELGHFLAARAFGIRVEKFYLFFDAWGFKLLSFKIGNTEYGIGWLPLGGYVKIAEMIDESMDKDQMKQPVQPWEFRAKPAWQRLIVMAAGVFVNLVVGILIFQFYTLWFEKNYLPVSEVNKYGIYATEAGREIGFMSGDKIISVNSKPVERFKDIASVKILMGSNVRVERDGNIIDLAIADDAYKLQKDSPFMFIDNSNYPFSVDSVMMTMGAGKAGVLSGDKIIALNGINIVSAGQFKENLFKYKNNETALSIIRNGDTIYKNVMVDSLGRIGIVMNYPAFINKEYNFGSAMNYGYKDALSMLVLNIKGLGKVFSGQEKFTESVSGPIGIAQIYGAHWYWPKFWYITGLLSLILAFMNVLPIPALDGGHILFTLIEIITRRKLSDKFMEYAQIAGMIIIFGLMIFVIGLDILKIFK